MKPNSLAVRLDLDLDNNFLTDILAMACSLMYRMKVLKRLRRYWTDGAVPLRHSTLASDRQVYFQYSVYLSYLYQLESFVRFKQRDKVMCPYQIKW